MKSLISIVIPAYNEEEAIPQLLKRLLNVIASLARYNFEIIVVENGSIDNTLRKLLEARRYDKRIKIIQLVKNATCDGGIIAGLTYASGDAAIIMMADLQDIPELIPEFLAKWKEGYEIVYGIVAKRKNMKLTRKLGTYLFYKTMNILSKGLVPENASDFRLIDKKVYQVVLSMSEHHKFFRGMVVWTGYKTVGIPFIRPDRIAGKSKADLTTVIKVAMNGMISFSFLPLRIAWFMSLLLLVACLISLFTASRQMTLVFLLFTFTSAMIAIQGEYLGRILEEVRDRPQFVIRNTFGLTQVLKKKS